MPGERATVMLLASDVKQARQLIRYCKGLIGASPMLARKVLNETKDALELTNRTVIEVNVANPRQTRGYTLAGVICDEIAFWPIDELSPKRDEDTLAALRPALLTLPHSKLIAITSPYARRGAAWNAYRKHFGQDASKVLVWQAPTLVMNPSADETAIAQACDRSPCSKVKRCCKTSREQRSFNSRALSRSPANGRSNCDGVWGDGISRTAHCAPSSRSKPVGPGRRETS